LGGGEFGPHSALPGVSPMVHAIISWSLHNRLIVILGVCALIGAGLFSTANLNVEAYPDPTPPLVEVIAQNPGASPEEMERLVSPPTRGAPHRHPRPATLRGPPHPGPVRRQ